MGSFNPKQKKYEVNLTEQLCIMTKKNEAKFEEETTCRFKIDTRNFTNFDPSTQTSTKFAF